MGQLGDDAPAGLGYVSGVYLQRLNSFTGLNRKQPSEPEWETLQRFRAVWISMRTRYDFEESSGFGADCGVRSCDKDSTPHIRYPSSRRLGDVYTAGRGSFKSGDYRFLTFHRLFSPCLVTTKYWVSI